MEEMEIKIDIQVDAAGRPSNLAAGGLGRANRKARGSGALKSDGSQGKDHNSQRRKMASFKNITHRR
ncbi:hypothetical protein Baya_7669 [Bagarius yarrelli]|uniref:Uncharacterized protein n=1 Tax=Bagarius yarrelli TaxID=175774 RepID=A0A556U3W8_BAGYA|nr:hypothetical protein Baya_7669 [Bagarius yarrelli]